MNEGIPPLQELLDKAAPSTRGAFKGEKSTTKNALSKGKRVDAFKKIIEIIGQNLTLYTFLLFLSSYINLSASLTISIQV